MRLAESFKTLGVVKLVQFLPDLDILQVIQQILGRADKRGVPAQLGRKDRQTACASGSGARSPPVPPHATSCPPWAPSRR